MKIGCLVEIVYLNPGKEALRTLRNTQKIFSPWKRSGRPLNFSQSQNFGKINLHKRSVMRYESSPLILTLRLSERTQKSFFSLSIFGREFIANKSQNTTKIKLRSLFLIFNSSFDHKNESTLFITLPWKGPQKFPKIHFSRTAN